MATRAWGDGLRRTLAQAGLSQTDLADGLGVTRQTVNAWITQDLNRRKRPSDDMRDAVAEYLGVSDAQIERAGLSDQPDLKPYERADAKAKTNRQNTIRAFSRRLQEHDPGLLRYVQRTVEYPGFGPAQRYDYADNSLVLLIAHNAQRPDNVYDALWKLYKARAIAERIGVERSAVLALIDAEEANDADFISEAMLAEVEVVRVDTPEELGDWVAGRVRSAA